MYRLFLCPCSDKWQRSPICPYTDKWQSCRLNTDERYPGDVRFCDRFFFLILGAAGLF